MTENPEGAKGFIVYNLVERSTLIPPCKPETLADAMYQVVIVEDDAAQAEIIRSMIECSPRGGELAIEHVVDAESLTARLAEEPAIDVLVMDIELGSEDANGIDLVKRYFPAGAERR